MKPNKYDAFTKAMKVIESCKTHYHLEAAQLYINLFNKMYRDIYLYRKLIDNIQVMRYIIIY